MFTVFFVWWRGCEWCCVQADPYVFEIDVVWWVYSRCVSLSVAQIETLSDGLLHEAIDTEPLASFQARLDQLQPRSGANREHACTVATSGSTPETYLKHEAL